MPSDERQVLSWDAEYSKNRQIWGERPSELALEAAKRLIRSKGRPMRVLDVGCGYGRDTIYIAKSLGFRILGIDISEKAIELAKENAVNALAKEAEFKVVDFRELHGLFNAILVSNFYHLLNPQGRLDLSQHVTRLLAPGGRLFLNAISVRDKEHYGVGTPVLGEENTWVDGKYIHLSTEEELRCEFAALTFHEFYELEYEEPHPGARTHNHLAWIIVAEKVG
jgi:cyclopropane fatty-acyl-phospholipid synthase-like methyltransferase